MRRFWAVAAAVAVCFAVSGLASAQSPSPSPATSGDLALAVVTGSFQCQSPTGGTQSLDRPPYWVRNFAFECAAKASDARVGGTLTAAFAMDSWDPAFRTALYWWDVNLQGPDGAWTGRAYGLSNADFVIHSVAVLAGSGAYDGLMYVATWTEQAQTGLFQTAGLIQPGDMPPGFVIPDSEPSPSPAPAGSPGPSAAPSLGTAWTPVTGATVCDFSNFPRIACTETASDPRVSGLSTRNVNLVSSFPNSPDGIMWNDVTVNGPDGRWTGMGYAVVGSDGIMRGVEISAGDGGYAGLVYAIVETIDPNGNATATGFIQPGSLPTGLLQPGVIVSPTPTPFPEPTTIGQAADDGARIIAADAVDARTRDLTIESPALGDVNVKVRLLLPKNFDAQPTTTWPVLYLLHGAHDDYTSWTRSTDVETVTADYPIIVIMPQASFYNGAGAYQDGWYTDWYNGGANGPPAWETFHLTELLQLIERNYRAGDQRVLAGLSMGGYGALNYLSRHPDLFKAGASYSGVLDLKVNANDFTDADAIARWGDPVANADIWDSHNPIKFVSTLKGQPLYISYGNGQPGPLDEAGTEPDPTETWIGQGSDLFIMAMNDAGVTATVDAYGPGTHSWPYWERALHASLPMLLQALVP